MVQHVENHLEPFTGHVRLPRAHHGHEDLSIYCDLRVPDHARVLQILVHGGTYTHRYWDLPDPIASTDRYSYVAWANRAGYATLSIDLPGRGTSSNLPSADVNVDLDAWVVTQLVLAAKTSGFPALGRPDAFEAVVVVGHSMGSMAIWRAVEQYPETDIDGAILSGIAHWLNPAWLPEDGFVLAHADPNFPDDMDPGWITTAPGMRGPLYYADGKYEPRLVEFDEDTKDAVPAGWLDVDSTASGRDDPALVDRPENNDMYRRVHAFDCPVMVALGDRDLGFCQGSVADKAQSLEDFLKHEAPFLGANVPSVEPYILRDSGHSLNGMYSAREWFKAAQDWVARATTEA